MIAIGSDHGGYRLKEELKKYLEEIGLEYKDFGTQNEERTDYPIYAKEVAKAVSTKECEKGILISIVSEEDVRFAKADDDINVLTLGSNCLATKEAIRIMRTWIATDFKGGRYQERIDMITEIENENMK